MKQRLIGGLVVIALLAIFLPILLYRSNGNRAVSVSMQIPEAPSVPQVALPLPPPKAIQPIQSARLDKSVTLTHSVQVSELNKINKIKHDQIKKQSEAKNRLKQRNSVKQKISVKQKNIMTKTPVAWVVQLASFSDITHAQRLLRRLRRRGFDAYTRQALDARHQSVTRIYVGPIISRTQVQQLQQRLKKQFRLTGIIRKYTS